MKRIITLITLASLSMLQPASAQIISDVTNTKHNLSVTGPGTAKASTEAQGQSGQ